MKIVPGRLIAGADIAKTNQGGDSAPPAKAGETGLGQPRGPDENTNRGAALMRVVGRLRTGLHRAIFGPGIAGLPARLRQGKAETHLDRIPPQYKDHVIWIASTSNKVMRPDLSKDAFTELMAQYWLDYRDAFNKLVAENGFVATSYLPKDADTGFMALTMSASAFGGNAPDDQGNRQIRYTSIPVRDQSNLPRPFSKRAIRRDLQIGQIAYVGRTETSPLIAIFRRTDADSEVITALMQTLTQTSVAIATATLFINMGDE